MKIQTTPASPQQLPEVSGANPNPQPITNARAFKLAPEVPARLSPGYIPPEPELEPPAVVGAVGEVVALLRKIVEQLEKAESDQPILRIWEFDLAAGASQTVSIDTYFARWIVWARTSATPATDFIRVSQMGSVPGIGAIDVSSGRTAIIPRSTRMLTVLNAGANTAHVSIVADSGGLFQVI